MTGGYRFWARPNTIRLRPWRRVPFTAGNRRTWFDIALYVVLVVGLVVPLVSRACRRLVVGALPDNTSGLVSPVLLIVPIVGLVLIGLRDKTIFLAARGEQYLPAFVFFAGLPFVDMIIALKLLIVTVWFWAGVSKFGLHFTSVIPPMVSNSPSMPLKWLKRKHYRHFPDDLRPSHLATFMAHGPGTVVEIISPLVLLFSPWPWLTVDRGGDHGLLPPVHHLDVPAGGSAGVERALRLRGGVPVPRLPQLRTGTPSGTCPRCG